MLMNKHLPSCACHEIMRQNVLEANNNSHHFFGAHDSLCIWPILLYNTCWCCYNDSVWRGDRCSLLVLRPECNGSLILFKLFDVVTADDTPALCKGSTVLYFSVWKLRLPPRNFPAVLRDEYFHTWLNNSLVLCFITMLLVSLCSQILFFYSLKWELQHHTANCLLTMI